ncbi:hypothetical protein J4526_04240 [Desulfurococcaceae archaeon MEX13E-LK6-19]|nr:hypothetical protein J4526_04240 [Desulfurococcaceae archaeon MEX13E-LK6-19]
MAKKKIVTIGLDLSKISDEILEEVASRIEEKIRSLLSEALSISRSYDADIVVALENKGTHIDVSIDIELGGELGDIIDYDTVLQGVIKEVSKFVEQELLRVAGKETSKGDSGSKQDTDNGAQER